MNSLLPFQNNGLESPLFPYDFEFPPPLHNSAPRKLESSKKGLIKGKTTKKTQQKTRAKRRRLAT